jgi:hypothetical protein
MSNYDSHPTHEAYLAGQQYAMDHPNCVAKDAQREAREHQDVELYMDGFYNIWCG